MLTEIPEFDKRNLLPEGFYHPSLEDFIDRFVNVEDIEKRANLFEKYIKFCLKCLSTNALDRHYVDGSYVSKETEPGDVDLLVILDGLTVDDGPDELYEEYIELENREAIKEEYSCHVWCSLEYPEDMRELCNYFNNLENAVIKWWQTNFLDEERTIIDPIPKGVIILSKSEIEKMRSL